jgi:transcriptional regulator with XRE-family HTH domain
VNKKFPFEIELVGKRIRLLRLENQMTQSHLATMCDVDIRTIQRIEKGQQNISLTLLLSLITSLNTNVNKLLGDLHLKTEDSSESP